MFFEKDDTRTDPGCRQEAVLEGGTSWISYKEFTILSQNVFFKGLMFFEKHNTRTDPGIRQEAVAEEGKSWISYREF